MKSLLRKMTLPETRNRIEMIWSKRAETKDPSPFDNLLISEVGDTRTKVNRSRHVMWLSLAFGAALALTARRIFRWAFLHDGGHPSWVKRLDTFSHHRPCQ